MASICRRKKGGCYYVTYQVRPSKRRTVKGSRNRAATEALTRKLQTDALLRKDLQAAGIPYRDASDRAADFHALRHTFITRLARSGVAPAVANSLARHSTITLTMNHSRAHAH